ncbi:MAG: hypothetical protein VB124_03420, partial [Burkholderia sp.]
DTVAHLRLARLALVPAHLLEAKNRESSQETELLTGVLDWLLGINVNRSLARPIYATTPSRAGNRAPRTPAAIRRVCLSRRSCGSCRRTRDDQRAALLPLALHAQHSTSMVSSPTRCTTSLRLTFNGSV